MSTWLDSRVNNRQTPAERRQKYAYLRSKGVSSAQASSKRDWRWSTLTLYIQAISTL